MTLGLRLQPARSGFYKDSGAAWVTGRAEVERKKKLLRVLRHKPIYRDTAAARLDLVFRSRNPYR